VRLGVFLGVLDADLLGVFFGVRGDAFALGVFFADAALRGVLVAFFVTTTLVFSSATFA
jgi:hypothetical protein